MRFVDALLSGLIQVVLWVGGIIATGFLVAVINSLFYKVVGKSKHGLGICIFTGAIGTPIHELGHALFCLIFFNKITELALFTPKSQDGTLGHVTHIVPKNPYSKLGQFFIGVGPIILGSAILILLMFLLARNVFGVLSALMEFFSVGVGEGGSFVGYIQFITGGIALFIGEMFSVKSLTSPLWYLFVILGSFISLHMRLSKADINGSLSGLLLTIGVVFFVPFIVGLISPSALQVVSRVMTTGGVSVLCVYIMVIMMALFTVFLSFLITPIIILIDKIKAKSKSRKKAA